MLRILEPAYQPIYDLIEERVSHYEALARLQGDTTDKGHGQFLGIAEKYRFIHEVDLAICAHVLEQARSHDHEVALNVTPFTIERAYHDLVELFSRHQCIAGRVIVEITETLPITQTEKIHKFMAFVRAMGGRIALDDFGNGVGHFSEGLVLELKPDFLKLDGEVLTRAVFFKDTKEIEAARSIVDSFGGELIAEYVDTAQKVDYLRSTGVRYAQGAKYGLATRGALLRSSEASREPSRAVC